MYSYLKTVHLQQMIYPTLSVLVHKITVVNNKGRETGRARCKKKSIHRAQGKSVLQLTIGVTCN